MNKYVLATLACLVVFGIYVAVAVGMDWKEGGGRFVQALVFAVVVGVWGMVVNHANDSRDSVALGVPKAVLVGVIAVEALVIAGLGFEVQELNKSAVDTKYLNLRFPDGIVRQVPPYDLGKACREFNADFESFDFKSR